nr:Transcription factor CBF NF-Y archaeal histone domain containing protein [Haemonchus contortus]
MSSEADTISQEHVQVAELLNCTLPTSRVKKICRLDPDLSMIGSDAVLFITKATELFVAELAKASYTQAVLEKRKTIQTKDIDRAIASKAIYEFLDGALTDWPEPASSKVVSQAESNVEVEAIAEEDPENAEEDDADVEEAMEANAEEVVQGNEKEDEDQVASDSGGAEESNSNVVDMLE